MRLLALACCCLLMTGCARISEPELGDLERRLLAPHLDSKNNVKLPNKVALRSGRVILIIPKAWGGKPTVHPDTWKFTGNMAPTDVKTLGTVIFLKKSTRKKKFTEEKTRKPVEITYVDYKMWAFDARTNAYLGKGSIDAPEISELGETVKIDKETMTPINPPPREPDLEHYVKIMTSSD